MAAEHSRTMISSACASFMMLPTGFQSIWSPTGMDNLLNVGIRYPRRTRSENQGKIRNQRDLHRSDYIRVLICSFRLQNGLIQFEPLISSSKT